MVYSGDTTLQLHRQALCASLRLPQEVHLVLDAPWGYALVSLEDLPRPVMVVTGVGSSPYLRDLLDLEPEGLLAHSVGPQDVIAGLTRVASGERFYEGPTLVDDLQPCERAVLRRVAFGHRIVTLKEKLQVRNRVELALYYLGMHPRLWACGKLTL
ncbi:MAG: response regulator transcription factor [Meiothermus silvanus]|nr:response regulator transcription factor [Allomeiothermus silvanus]